MRINKYLAASNQGSRRKSEELVLNGHVTINGKIVKDLSYVVNTDLDEVKVDNKIVKPSENMIYIALNKPAGYLSSTTKQFGKPCVIELLKDVKESVYPVGRLDFNTKGLLIITNDGAFTNKVIHPTKEIEKEYQVSFKGILTTEKQKLLTSSLNIDGYKIRPAVLKNVANHGNFSSLNIVIHEGRNRQIRKMFEMAELKIIDLKRIRIGGFCLPKIKEGEYKILTKDELRLIFK